MDNIFKIGAIGLGTFFGFKYFNAISKAKNLKFAFSNITINAINSNAFQIGIWLKVSSTNNGNLALSKSRLKAYLNGTLCGVAVLPYDQIISGQHTTDVYLICDLYYKDTFKEWWNLLLKASTTATLTIAGGLVVAGTYIPIPALNVKEFSLKDTIQEIKSSNVGNVSIDINLFKNSGYEFYREFFRVNKLEKIYINETLVLSLIIDEKIYKETTDRYISFRWGKIEYNANNQIYLYYKDIKQVLIDKNRLAIQEGNKNFLFVFKNNVIIPNMTPISDQERGKRYNEFRSFLDSYK